MIRQHLKCAGQAGSLSTRSGQHAQAEAGDATSNQAHTGVSIRCMPRPSVSELISPAFGACILGI